MKKLFAIIAIAGVFTACNNDAETTTTTTDSMMTTDTMTMAPMNDTSHMLVDSMNHMDTMHK